MNKVKHRQIQISYGVKIDCISSCQCCDAPGEMKSGQNNRVGQMHDYHDREIKTENQRHSTFTDTLSSSIDKLPEKANSLMDTWFLDNSSPISGNVIRESFIKHDLRSETQKIKLLLADLGSVPPTQDTKTF